MYYNNKHRIEPKLQEEEKVYLLRKNVQTKRPSNKLDHKKLGLFEIKTKLRPVIYKLKLPKTIEIYPVFYISLLEKALPGALLALITEV